DTPLMWRGRVRSVSETEAMLKELYFKKSTFTVITPSGTFNNMGITSMQIKRSTELGFDKEVSLSLKEVPTTETKTAAIPASYGKSGATGANAGTASTGTGSTGSGGASGSSGSGGSSSSKKQSSGSILYNVASAAGLV
ncbi:MAG: phage baseplate protein, partial [Oscillospiraceae bacterium]